MMSSYPQEEESVVQVQVLPNDIVDDNQSTNQITTHHIIQQLTTIVPHRPLTMLRT